MVRNYKRLTSKSYTDEDLKAALKSVRNKEFTAFAAAKLYSIPYSTLKKHLNGEALSNKPGKPTLLTYEEEEALVDALVFLADCGFGLNNKLFRNVVTSYIKKIGFLNNLNKNIFISFD